MSEIDLVVGVNTAERGRDCDLFREEWKLNGDDVLLNTCTPYNSTQTKFRFNQMFEDDTFDGKKAKTMYTDECNRIVCRQLRQPSNVFQTRELQKDGKMMLTITIDETQPITARIVFIRDRQSHELPHTQPTGVHASQNQAYSIAEHTDDPDVVIIQGNKKQKDELVQGSSYQERYVGHQVQGEHLGPHQPLSSVVQRMAGKWREESDDNLDVFMKALG